MKHLKSTNSDSAQHKAKMQDGGLDFGVETQVWEAAENDKSKLVNLTTGEVRNASSFDKNPTWSRVILKAGN